MSDRTGHDRILGLETSTRVCSVAVTASDRIVAEQTWDADVQHAERLLPVASELLSHLAWQPGDLAGVAVSSGPGSFTGVRIAMATAKGLCLGSGLPLMCVPTLAALAYPVGMAGLPVCAMLDARRDQVYAGVYRFSNGDRATVLPDSAVSIADLLPELPRPVLVVGEGAHVYGDRIREVLGSDARFLPPPFNRPNAGAVALMGAQMLARGETADPAAAEPSYLRRSQAERVRDAQLGRDQPGASGWDRG